MPVQINDLEVNVNAPGGQGATAAPATLLPQAAEAWRAAWIAASAHEQQARRAATDRDDER